jgi:hypothetical protein
MPENYAFVDWKKRKKIRGSGKNDNKLKLRMNNKV